MANTIKIKHSGTASNSPSSLEYGELAINYADGKLFYKNSSDAIVEFSAGGSSGATISTTAPVSPTAGQIWYESGTGSTFVYTGSVWVEVGTGMMSPYQCTSTTHPSSPWGGQMIFETDTKMLKIWNGTVWKTVMDAT